MNDLQWFVAHTRPRREKKLAEYAVREGCLVTLPKYRRVHKYRGKTVVFEKPLFPNYVFLQVLPQQRQRIFQSDHVVALLEVVDQELFVSQLEAVLRLLEEEVEIQLAPEIGKGTRVRVTAGPLRGMDGWVEERYGMTTVLLRIDFIGQAAAVKLEAHQLEPA